MTKTVTLYEEYVETLKKTQITITNVAPNLEFLTIKIQNSFCIILKSIYYMSKHTICSLIFKYCL